MGTLKTLQMLSCCAHLALRLIQTGAAPAWAARPLAAPATMGYYQGHVNWWAVQRQGDQATVQGGKPGAAWRRGLSLGKWTWMVRIGNSQAKTETWNKDEMQRRRRSDLHPPTLVAFQDREWAPAPWVSPSGGCQKICAILPCSAGSSSSSSPQHCVALLSSHPCRRSCSWECSTSWKWDAKKNSTHWAPPCNTSGLTNLPGLTAQALGSSQLCRAPSSLNQDPSRARCGLTAPSTSPTHEAATCSKNLWH